MDAPSGEQLPSLGDEVGAAYRLLVETKLTVELAFRLLGLADLLHLGLQLRGREFLAGEQEPAARERLGDPEVRIHGLDVCAGVVRDLARSETLVTPSPDQIADR